MKRFKFTELVEAELNRIRRRNYTSINSYHEGYGLLAEEVDEFWDEVKKRPAKRDQSNALRELLQISALCQRIAEDLHLISQADIEERIDSGTKLITKKKKKKKATNPASS